MGLFSRPFNFGAPAETRPYVPSHAALALDMADLVHDPEPITGPGVMVANGQIAGASNGGAVQLGGRNWGFDFVAAEGDNTKVYLLPAEKNAVRVDRPEENRGELVDEGLAILSLSDEGLLVIAGIVTSRFWEAEQARSNRARVSQLGLDRWCIQTAFPLRAEMADIDKSGVTAARWLPS